MTHSPSPIHRSREPDDEITIDGVDLLSELLEQAEPPPSDCAETIDGAALLGEIKGERAASSPGQATNTPKNERPERWRPPSLEGGLPATSSRPSTQLNAAVVGLVFALCLAGSWFVWHAQDSPGQQTSIEPHESDR